MAHIWNQKSTNRKGTDRPELVRYFRKLVCSGPVQSQISNFRTSSVQDQLDWVCVGNLENIGFVELYRELNLEFGCAFYYLYGSSRTQFFVDVYQYCDHVDITWHVRYIKICLYNFTKCFMTLNLSNCKYTVAYLRKHYFSKHGGAQSSFLESIIRKSNTGCK